MSQTPITVTYDLKELFTKIDERLTRIEADLSEVKSDVKSLTVEVKAIKEDLVILKGSQRNQIWALIGILATGVVGVLVRSFTLKP